MGEVKADIGVAVIGFGLAGRVFHAPFVSAVPGLKLEAIVQRRGDEAAKAYPKARILRSFEEALQDKAVQLVVVGTPNETHYELARKAIEAGKHVVIDKPFAATSVQAKELWQLAWEKGVVLAPFHNRRWDGDFLTVQELIDKNAVGRLVTFESHFDRFRPLQRENTWKESSDPANGLLFAANELPPVGTEIRFELTMPAAVMGGVNDVLLHCLGRIVRHQRIADKEMAAAVIDEYSFRG